MKPTILINFKTYEESTGKNAVRLARIADDIAKKNKYINMIVAVQPADIYTVKKSVSIPVFAQHVDPVGHGKYTGHITPESVKASGASGTLLNHSEKPMELNKLGMAIGKAKRAGLSTVVCVNDEKTAMSVAALEPDMISVEPPELISTGVAVSLVKPEVISNSVRLVRQLKRIRVLCGAGIRKPDDIREALKLGVKGILISSGVVLSENPKEYLLEMIKAFHKDMF